jgi:uncharacterized protein
MMLAAFAAQMQSEATPVAQRSPWHGPAHWRDVARFGIEFAEHAGGDPVVAFVFGAMHDTQRVNDHDDPAHGYRAAELARLIRDTHLSFLTDSQMTKLAYGLEFHDTGQTSNDPTIGAMWDADRVTLWRVGVEPSARFMSTALAKADPGAKQHAVMRDALTWEQIARRAA